MAYSLDNRLVIGVSSRALFELTVENDIFEREGVQAYSDYTIAHEKEILKPGPGFSLIKALLDINKLKGQLVIRIKEFIVTVIRTTGDHDAVFFLISRRLEDLLAGGIKQLDADHFILVIQFCGGCRLPADIKFRCIHKLHHAFLRGEKHHVHLQLAERTDLDNIFCGAGIVAQKILSRSVRSAS